jgi:hypothetical protein
VPFVALAKDGAAVESVDELLFPGISPLISRIKARMEGIPERRGFAH